VVLNTVRVAIGPSRKRDKPRRTQIAIIAGYFEKRLKVKKIISTTKAPLAIGPYSQGIIINGFLFCSGQIPINPETGELVSGGIAAQTERVMKNLEEVLIASGVTFENVVKSTIFLTSIENFSVVNEVYGRYFISEPPVRSTVEVKGLPKGAEVEIEIIAELP